MIMYYDRIENTIFAVPLLSTTNFKGGRNPAMISTTKFNGARNPAMISTIIKTQRQR